MKLLKCPFCGRKSTVTKRLFTTLRKDYPVYNVNCSGSDPATAHDGRIDCGIVMQGLTGEKRSSVVQRWNTRCCEISN